jgi:hypothetical protein
MERQARAAKVPMREGNERLEELIKTAKEVLD